MPNKNYLRSRARETKVKNEFQSKGYYAIRAAGSKGVADVVAIKPSDCGHGEHFDVRFIQIKVSENLRKEKTIFKTEEVPFGLINVEYMKFPVKSKKWHEHTKKIRRKSKKNTPSSRK